MAKVVPSIGHTGFTTFTAIFASLRCTAMSGRLHGLHIHILRHHALRGCVRHFRLPNPAISRDPPEGLRVFHFFVASAHASSTTPQGD